MPWLKLRLCHIHIIMTSLDLALDRPLEARKSCLGHQLLLVAGKPVRFTAARHEKPTLPVQHITTQHNSHRSHPLLMTVVIDVEEKKKGGKKGRAVTPDT